MNWLGLLDSSETLYFIYGIYIKDSLDYGMVIYFGL